MKRIWKRKNVLYVFLLMIIDVTLLLASAFWSSENSATLNALCLLVFECFQY